MSARLRHRRRRRKGRLDGRDRITITHELGERPAIADRRERVGEGEGDTVAGRIGGAVLVTPVDRATGYLVGGKAPSKRAVDVSLLNRAGPCPPHRRPLTVDRGGHEFAPGPALQEPLGAPRPLLRGPLRLAARLRREHQRPAARALPQEDPTGRHQPHADPTSARSTQPTTTQTPRLENP